MTWCLRVLHLSAVRRFVVVLSTIAAIIFPMSFSQAQAPQCQDLFLSDESILQQLRALANLQANIKAGEFNSKLEDRHYAEKTYQENISAIAKKFGLNRFKVLYAQAQKTINHQEIQEKQTKREEKERKIEGPEKHIEAILNNLLKIKNDEFFDDKILSFFERMNPPDRENVSRIVLQEWINTDYQKAKFKFYIQYINFIEKILNSSETKKQKLFSLDMVHMSLATAESNNMKEVFEYLIKQPGIDLNESKALMLALKRDWKDTFEYIMKQPGINFNTQDSKGNAVLHLVLERDWKEEFEFIIKQPGVDLSTQNQWGNTILELIMLKDWKDHVDYVLQHPSINLSSPNSLIGNKLLDLAMSKDWKDTFEYIMEHHRVEPIPNIVQAAQGKGWL